MNADDRPIELSLEPAGKINLDRIAAGVRLILEGIGEDPARQGILDTPRRVAEMFAEICGGLHEDPMAELKVIPADTGDDAGEKHDGIVMVRDITIGSLCEHHLLPFTGMAHIAYIPRNGQIVGLSKLARIVDIFARRPQVQERLNTQIADTLYRSELQPAGVLVVIEAVHLCMVMRGIKKPGATTITSALRGVFRTDERLRHEAMSFLTGNRRGY
ncbi:MAG TPA: GTP cyclohydrolase I FolE [Blastocatellia bacterium]|nr:GTP cyclohydrolase I FolE [Blastocatellia bacterium]